MNNLGLKSAFQVGKSKNFDFSVFSYIFPIKMYGNRQVAGGACRSSPNDPKLFVCHFYIIVNEEKKEVRKTPKKVKNETP